jgi:thiol-disulfide isomerase/thioredoxin
MASKRMPQLLLLLAVTSCLFWSLGCNSGSNDSTVGSGDKSKAAGTESSTGKVPSPQCEPPLTQPSNSANTAAASSVTVHVVDRAGFNEVLGKHKGQIILVDYWATWCGPCRKNFPHTVALAKEHQAAGLTVIGVSMDDEDAHEEVVKFLTEQHATFLNLRCKTGASDESFASFEIPNDTLPCLRLFDREGQPIKTFAIDPTADKQFTDDEVAEAVRAALAK